MRIIPAALMMLTAMQLASAQTINQALPAAVPPPPATVELHIDRSKVIAVGKLNVGITETHLSADHKDAVPAAAARGNALTQGVAAFQNTHIQGWGVGPIEPKPGVWDWASMDHRMDYLRRQHIPIIITLCTAPGWMKVENNDWAMGSPIRPDRNDDFAHLCVEVAKRYPDVRYFQIWNEFKGYWNASAKEWDVEGYTAMYNKVYDALKAHDAGLKIGGFYLVVAGTGSEAFGYTGTNVDVPMKDSQKQLLRYWTDHRHGADFVCADKGIPDYHDRQKYPDDVLMALTPSYQKVTRELHELSGGLPVWWSEFYSFGRDGNLDLTGASYASAYIHALLGGASMALVWNPNGGELNCYLYSDVRQPAGGQPTPHYTAFKAMAEHFPPGTEIVATTSTSPWIEILASKAGAALIVNKWSKPVKVILDGKSFDMAGYEIKVVP